MIAHRRADRRVGCLLRVQGEVKQCCAASAGLAEATGSDALFVAEAAAESRGVDVGKIMPSRNIDFVVQGALLEHRAVGEDHDGWFLGVWT